VNVKDKGALLSGKFVLGTLGFELGGSAGGAVRGAGAVGIIGWLLSLVHALPTAERAGVAALRQPLDIC